MIEIVGLNFADCTAVFSDGSSSKFYTMFDELGEETKEINEALAAIVQVPDCRWAVI